MAAPTLASLVLLALLVPLRAQEPSARPVTQDEKAASASEAGSRAPAQAALLAFVDMEKIIENLPETKEKTEKLKQDVTAGIEALKQQAERMRSMQDSLDLLKEDTPDFNEQLRKINVLKATLQLDRQILMMKANRDLVQSLKEIYQRCKEVIGQVAEERGIQIVAMYSSSEVQGRNRNELIGDIITRPFVYIHPSLDVTDVVLERMTK